MYPGQWGSSQPDETTALKYKQIDSLRQCFPTVKEISRDTLYEVAITLPSRRIVTLRITLGRDFPRVPPQLQIFPAVQHKFVDQQQNVLPQAHENLQRWSVHASLGKTIYEIVQQFVQQPPQILPQNVPPTSTIPPPSSNNFIPSPNPQNNFGSTSGLQNLPPSSVTLVGQQNQPKTHTPLPVIPGSFPELDSKSPPELAQLLNDENEFKKFFENLSAVSTMRKVRDDLRINNEELAKRNLAKEAEIERIKRELSTRHQAVNEKRSSFEQKAQRQQEVMKQFSTPALIDHLTVAAHEAELESDAIANKFLNGEIDQKTFIRDFMEKRKLYHLRSAKKESLIMLAR